MMAIRTNILGFYERVARSREGLEYLDLFHRLQPGRFAILWADNHMMETELESLGEALAYLSRLKLPLAVVFESKSTDTGNILKKGQALADLIIKLHGKAVVVQKPEELPGLDSQGLWSVDQSPALALCEAGIIPIFGPVSGTQSGLTAHPDRSWGLFHQLAFFLKPSKTLVIAKPGGIQGSDGSLVSRIVIREKQSLDLSDDGQNLFERLVRLLDDLGQNTAAQITSPANLLPELFTDKGGGSFMTLGYRIQEYTDWTHVAKGKVENLVYASFGKNLVKGYFDRPVERILLENEYLGSAVLGQSSQGFYLDKFVVHPDVQSRGLGSQLFRRSLDLSKGRLFWRTFAQNPTNSFYFRVCEKCEKTREWNLYCVGLGEAAWTQAKEYMGHLPKTLAE